LPKLERDVCQTYYTLDGESFYTFDEFQAINGVRDFDPTIDEFKTASMAMNSSDYVDDYDDDYDDDNYSMDSIDKYELRAEKFKDKWLEQDD